jgi:hypothetical protein
MKALFTLVMGFLLSTSVYANDFAAAVGFRSNSADAVTAGNDVTSKTGFGAGVIGFFDLASQFQLRSGFLYTQRNFGLGLTGGTDYDTNASYVDIPVTAMYRFADYAGIFAGPVAALLVSKDCKTPGGCSTSPEGMDLGLQFGASFKFASQLGAEVYYETIPSTFWKDAMKNARAVGVNLLFTFE